MPRQEVITAYPDALVSTTEDGDIAYLTFQKTAAQADEESLPVAYLGIGPIAYSEIKLDEASTTPPTEPAVPEAPEVRPGANAQAGASFDAVLGTSRYAIGDDMCVSRTATDSLSFYLAESNCRAYMSGLL